MGTNYYRTSEACEHCGRADQRLHIGKPRDGYFILRIYPYDDELPSTVDEWISLVLHPQTVLVTSYDQPIDRDELVTRLRGKVDLCDTEFS